MVSLSSNGQWLKCTAKQGKGIAPLPDTLQDDTTEVTVAVAQIQGVTDRVVNDGDGRYTDGTNLLMINGACITVAEDRADIAAALGMT